MRNAGGRGAEIEGGEYQADNNGTIRVILMTDNDRELFSLSDEQQKLIEAGFKLKGTPVIEKVDMHEIMTSLVRSNPQEAIEDAFLFGHGTVQTYSAKS